MRGAVVWAAVVAAVAVPVALSLASPLLQWRSPLYIAAGLAGVVGMGLMLVQPMLAAGLLPGLAPGLARRVHRWTGVALVGLVVAHVAGLWITSPPDVIDALLFVSPTPFAPWGVVAMWALLATAALAALRRPLRLRWRVWRLGHTGLAVVIVTGTAVHALLVEGTMETLSKAALAALVLAATARAVLGPRAEGRGQARR